MHWFSYIITSVFYIWYIFYFKFPNLSGDILIILLSLKKELKDLLLVDLVDLLVDRTLDILTEFWVY